MGRPEIVVNSISRPPAARAVAAPSPGVVGFNTLFIRAHYIRLRLGPAFGATSPGGIARGGASRPGSHLRGARGGYETTLTPRNCLASPLASAALTSMMVLAAGQPRQRQVDLEGATGLGQGLHRKVDHLLPGAIQQGGHRRQRRVALRPGPEADQQAVGAPELAAGKRHGLRVGGDLLELTGRARPEDLGVL